MCISWDGCRPHRAYLSSGFFLFPTEHQGADQSTPDTYIGCCNICQFMFCTIRKENPDFSNTDCTVHTPWTPLRGMPFLPQETNCRSSSMACYPNPQLMLPPLAPYSVASKLLLPCIFPPLSDLSQDFPPLALELSVDLTPYNLASFVSSDPPLPFSQNCQYKEGSKDHIRKSYASTRHYVALLQRPLYLHASLHYLQTLEPQLLGIYSRRDSHSLQQWELHRWDSHFCGGKIRPKSEEISPLLHTSV